MSETRSSREARDAEDKLKDELGERADEAADNLQEIKKTIAPFTTDKGAKFSIASSRGEWVDSETLANQ